MTLALRANQESGFTCAIGVGGIGSGIMYSLYGKHDLGRNESRLANCLIRGTTASCTSHRHYVARLMGAGRARTVSGMADRRWATMRRNADSQK